jgi:hypothetical protein
MSEKKYTTADKVTALHDALTIFDEIATNENRFGYFVRPGWHGQVLHELLCDLQEEHAQRTALSKAKMTPKVIYKPTQAKIEWALETMRVLGDMSDATSRRVLEVLIGPFEKGDADG